MRSRRQNVSRVPLKQSTGTLSDGKYSNHLRKAADWLMGVAQRNGVISPLNQLGRGYMHDHGYALLFLACLYGEEEEEREEEGRPLPVRRAMAHRRDDPSEDRSVASSTDQAKPSHDQPIQ